MSFPARRRHQPIKGEKRGSGAPPGKLGTKEKKSRTQTNTLIEESCGVRRVVDAKHGGLSGGRGGHLGSIAEIGMQNCSMPKDLRGKG